MMFIVTYSGMFIKGTRNANALAQHRELQAGYKHSVKLQRITPVITRRTDKEAPSLIRAWQSRASWFPLYSMNIGNSLNRSSGNPRCASLRLTFELLHQIMVTHGALPGISSGTGVSVCATNKPSFGSEVEGHSPGVKLRSVGRAVPGREDTGRP